MTRTSNLTISALTCCLFALTGCGGGSSSDEPQGQGPSLDGGGGDDATADAPSDSPFTGTMQCGDLPVANTKCATCADEHCCDLGNACAAHQDCVDLRACRKGCAPTDDACQSSCAAQHPEGASFDAALSACRMHECSDDCYSGAASSCGFQVAPDACQTCAETWCCDVGYAAFSDAAFWDYFSCILECQADTCFQGCASDHPQGRLVYATWLGCLGTSCAAPCAISTAYTCGAAYSAPCDGCVSASCCTESTACFQDAGCVGVATCAQGCSSSDTACLDGCKTGGGADATWEALHACLTGVCATQCAQ